MIIYPLLLSRYIFTHGLEAFLKVLLLVLLPRAPLCYHSYHYCSPYIIVILR